MSRRDTLSRWLPSNRTPSTPPLTLSPSVTTKSQKKPEPFLTLDGFSTRPPSTLNTRKTTTRNPPAPRGKKRGVLEKNSTIEFNVTKNRLRPICDVGYPVYILAKDGKYHEGVIRAVNDLNNTFQVQYDIYRVHTRFPTKPVPHFRPPYHLESLPIPTGGGGGRTPSDKKKTF